METITSSAQTTARATASLASNRSILARLDTQRTALQTHEIAVLVHSIAVQNLVNYPAAALINFSSPNATTLIVDRILDAEDNVPTEATREIGYEIAEALGTTAIAALTRESANGVFRTHGIYTVMANRDGYIGGEIHLPTTAARFPELPIELQTVETHPLSAAEQGALVAAAAWAKDAREELVEHTPEDALVEAHREIDEFSAVLLLRRDGEHTEGMRLLDTVGRAVPETVRQETWTVELERSDGSLVPVRLLGKDGQELSGSADAVRDMIEDGLLVERLAGLGAGVPEVELESSGITTTENGMVIHFA